MSATATTSMQRQLENQLACQKEPEKRLLLLDALAKYSVFTNVQEAGKLLKEEKGLLDRFPDPDLQLNFHYHSALVENQLYHFKRSEEHFLAAIELVEERGNVGQQTEVYIDYAGTCLNLEKYEQALDLLEKASKLLEVFPDKQLLARITCREGWLNLHVSNYSRAIELLLESESSISKLNKLELKDYYFLTLIHSGLGTIYQQSKEIRKSVRSYRKVLEICHKTGMGSRLSWHCLNVGRGYIALNDIENAEVYLHKALGISDDSSLLARAGAYGNLGYCYFLREEYDSALELYDKAETLYTEGASGNYSNLFRLESWRASLYMRTGNKDQTREHLIKAFDYAKKNNNYQELSIICKEIADFYSSIGDYENAFEYLQLHNDMGERYQEELNRRILTEMEVKYETEKRKQEAELLRLQASSLQLKALRAQMNPHFVYNALNSIQNYITSHEVTTAAKYLAKFAKLMRQSLDYSDLEIISLEKEIEFLQDYLMINQKLRFEDNLDYQVFVDEEIEEDIMGVPSMIVQPYVENAIEHGLRTVKNGLIKLEFHLKDEDTILCIVQDNGIGRAKAAKLKKNNVYSGNYRSKGTSITEKRLELLHKTRHRDSVLVKTIDLKNEKTGEPFGTRVEILIPVVDVHLKM